MQIGIDIRRLGDFGVGTYIRNLVQGLVRIGCNDEFVLVGQPSRLEKLGRLPPNFRFVQYLNNFDSPLSHAGYQGILRRLACDVFHMPHRWVPLMMPGTYVVTVHDLDTLFYPRENSSRYAERFRRYQLQRGLRNAARVITVSQATKSDAAKYLGVDPGKIEVVYNAIDEQIAQPVTQQERDITLDRYQVTDPFVLYAGRIQPHKNIPRLIEAFAVARSGLEGHPKFHNLKLIVIGDDINAFPSVRHSVIRTRTQHSVRFLGFVPMETLRVFYDCAEVFLFPSLYEGFGLPPLEAMAHGTPVVTSNVASLPEVFGDSAVLVNPENVFDIARGLTQLLTDDALREQLRQRGAERVKKFSWDRTAQRVLEIYQDVTSPNAAPS